MNARKLLLATLLAMIPAAAFAQTGPNVDTLNVQGYLQQSSGSPVTDGTYELAIAVCQNGVAVWGQEYSSVSVSGGLFTQALSGSGGNLIGLPGSFENAGCTGSIANWGTATLNPALLMASASGELNVRVYAVTAIDGKNPQFDIPVSAVPTAFVAETSYGLASGSLTLAMISASATTTTSSGGVGKIPLLSTGGQFDTSLIPNLDASIITTGQLGVAEGGTGAATAAAALTSLGAAANGSNTDITSLAPSGGSLSLGGATTTIINILPTGTNAAVDIASYGTGGLTVGGTGTGQSSFGNTGVGSVTTMTGPTVDVGNGSTTAVNVEPTGTNATVDIASNGSGALTVGGAGTGTATFGNYGGASETILQSGSGNVAIAGATQLILPTTAFSITQGASATGALTLATTNNQNLTLSPNGTGLVNISSGAGLTGNSASFTGNLSVGTTSGGILLGSTGNGVITIQQPVSGTAWTMTLPTSAGTANYVLTTDGSGNLSWANPQSTATINPTGTLNVGGGSTTVVDITPSGSNAAVDVASSGTGTLTLGGSGTGTATFGNTGAGSVTTVTGPTVDLGNATTTALNLTPTGTNAAVDIASNGSGLLTVGGTGTGNSVFGNTGTGSSTTLQSGTGGITVNPASISTASGTGTAISIAAGNETGTTSTGGSVTINAGTGTTQNGSVNIGTSNTYAVNIQAGSGGINFTATNSQPINFPSNGATLYVPTRLMQYLPNPNAATYTNIGFSAAATLVDASVAALNTQTAQYVTFTNTGTSGDCSGVVGPGAGYSPQSLVFEAQVATGASIASVRHGVGLETQGRTTPNGATCPTQATGGVLSVSSPTATDAAYFRFDTSVPDTKWMAVTCLNGTGCNAQSTGVSVAASTGYTMRIVTSSTQVLFYINGSLVATSTSDLPTATTLLQPVVGFATLTGAAQTLSIGRITVMGN